MSTVEQMAMIEVTSNLGSHLGPLLLGLAVDSLLLGVCVHQFIHYCGHHAKEATHVRFLLYLACLGAVAGTIFTWATSMHMFVYNYGLYEQFTSCDWIAWYGVLDPLTKISVQAFYAERAWRINKRNYFILVAIGICLCCSVTGSVGYTILARTKHMAEFDQITKIFFYLWPGACICADILITSSIMFGLYRSRSGYEHTDVLVRKLMRISLEAQVPPTIVALLFFTQFASSSMTSIVQFIAIIHPKVYLTGCLAILNSRESMRENKTTYVVASGSGGSGCSSSRLTKGGGVSITTETYVHSDGGSTAGKEAFDSHAPFANTHTLAEKGDLESPDQEKTFVLS
ncbi:hypothetical protein CI109_104902 [Kwoniella shandongensis]|uniref:Uncharacterized protein n=1 Tax=Kwoniella shandongensis TaxID=1734106 RepID=A0A5M6BVQ7_9TREE|nr:uncharacterized protein CI109_006620 [Kwoniella shandongensis]KAA5525069.1 hypothetical protein CI109_006620 [Kwoniella shandongensis]